jgi:hypothetical protein
MKKKYLNLNNKLNHLYNKLYYYYILNDLHQEPKNHINLQQHQKEKKVNKIYNSF